ncbi:MAG TPA: hypothetical protein G4N96_03690 [Chloroflexi bacterium]|nr:hypothetical protein [Chloroflexota bacterium]
MQKKIYSFALVLGMLLGLGVMVTAQNGLQVLEQSIESEFRDHITARLSAEGPDEITQVEFFYRVVSQKATSRNVVDFEPGMTVEAEYIQDQTSTYFPPGTELEYWWKLTDANDDTLKTERQTYLYLDNRYPFKTLSNDRITLYWYKGDDEFGQELFDQANRALDQLEKNVGVALEDSLKIFIYGSHNDLLDAISVGAQEWTGGQAFTDYGVVVMGVSPGNLDWGLKATTHELTHLVIHQATDNPYGDLPRWLDEGLAVYNEDPERLDSQFRHSFEAAVDSGSLMTLQTLSSSFPADSNAANLAYGESGAVVKFIIDTYGTEAMAHLLDIFSEGSLYDDALEEALGVDTRELDNAWRDSLGLPPIADAQVEAAPQPDSGSDGAEAEPDSGATPQSDSSSSEAQEESQSPSLPCLPGLTPIVALGVIAWNRRKGRASFF